MTFSVLLPLKQIKHLKDRTTVVVPVELFIENTRCLLISSLPGNALRTLVDITRLDERFNMRSQYQFTHCFTLQISIIDVISYFCVNSASTATSFKKCKVIKT